MPTAGKTRGAGRPKRHDARINIGLTAATKKALLRVAARSKSSMASAAEVLIEEALQKRGEANNK